MSVLPVTYYPNAPLKTKAKEITSFGAKLETLSRNMLETMHTFEGVGLAGPQVGMSRRILVLKEPEGDEMCLVNPEILEFEGSEEGEEGCLSMPGIYAMVPRATRITVRAYDVRGKQLDFEAENFLARIIQHECDHLEGIFFTDRLDIITQQTKLEEWAEAREALLNPQDEDETPQEAETSQEEAKAEHAS